MNRECCQCGNTKELTELLSGKYACDECLEVLGKEQLEITNRILDILYEYESLDKMDNKIKTLQSIALYLELVKGKPNGN